MEKINNNSEIGVYAVALIKNEKTAWDTATAFITERVAFQMRNLIRMLRRNYYGVFEEPNDPNTNRKKIWSPFTEYLVEAAVKNIDLDTKDIQIRALTAEARPLATVLRAAVFKQLNDINFGELLKMSNRQLAIDGTVVWKTYEGLGKDGKKKKMRVQLVDLLNFYIDPTVDSIEKAEAVIERSLMTPEEIERMTGWVNTTLDGKPLQGTLFWNRYDASLPNVPSTTASTAKLREVWERWGLMPKWLITGDKEKDTDQVEGHIVCSSQGSDWQIHLIEINLKGKKPYEEAWYTKVHGRWYGKGVAEKVMNLQLYLNTIVNTRVNRSIVQQLGLFKIKRGSNITPQIFARLSANGGIPVNDMDDIQPLELAQSGIKDSFNDEANIIDWGQKVTSLSDPMTGDQMPSDTTATGAAIQSQGSKAQFTLIKEGIGMWLSRWLKYQALPIIVKTLNNGEVLRLTEDIMDLQQYDEFLVNQQLLKQVDKMTAEGKFVDANQVLAERARELARLAKGGSQRFVKLDSDFDVTEYDVDTEITNEKIDKTALVQNLMTLFQTAGPQFQPGILDEIFDLVGLDSNQLKESAMQQTQAQQSGIPGQQPGQQPQGQPMQGQQPQGQPQQVQQPPTPMQNTPQPAMTAAFTQNAQAR